jgi:signal transduction histidine kinase
MLIRTRLHLLALAISVPAWLVSVYAVYYVYSEENRDYAKSMSESARTLALLVDNELRTKEAVLLALAKSPALVTGDLEAFKLYARQVVPETNSVIVLSSLDGQQLLNTRAPLDRALPSVDRELLSLTKLSPGRTVVSNLFVGAVAKRKDIAIDVPVYINGNLTYRMAMGVEAASFERLLQERRSTSWVMVVIDRNGRVLARSFESLKFVGRLASSKLLNRVLSEEERGINEGVTFEGTPVTTFFHRAPMSSWTVAILVPKEEMQRPARRAAIMLTIMIFGLLGFGFAVAQWYGRKTAVAIESLRSAAESMGRGCLVRVPNTDLQEVNLVGSALSNASELIQQHQAELERRVSEAIAATERSQRSLLQSQKLEALGRLTGGIAHDFNNILQTLTSALQLIGRTSDLSSIRRLSETSQRAVAKATSLTAQLRSFGRVQDVRMETVSLLEVISATLPLLKSSLPSNVLLETRLPETVWSVTIDRLQFELALLNTVINARDAMASGGTVQISVDQMELIEPSLELHQGCYVVVKIKDNGPGMSPEVLARAIDPFFTTKGSDTGSGLGLAQVHGFATQAGGGLRLQSQLRRGTSVLIYLPKSNLQATVMEKQCPPPLSLHGEGTVLFVEDDSLVRASVIPALSGAGFLVIEAKNADEALKILATQKHVDILFSDVVMPGSINGVDLAHLAQERYPDMPIILASGHTDLRINLSNLKMLGKPYDLDIVIALLIEQMRKIQPAR